MPNIKKIKKMMLKEKEKELLTFAVIEEYLTKRIIQGEKERRGTLDSVQKSIKELENQIEFLKK